MVSPVAVIGTDLGTFSDATPLVNLINHSGIADPFVSGTTSFDAYFASPRFSWATNGAGSNWQSDSSFKLPLTGYVDFDLGDRYMLNKFAIWNVSVENVVVRLAENPADLAHGLVAGEFVLTDHTSFVVYPVDILDFGSVLPGRYVRFAIESTYPIQPGLTIAYAMMGEVVASVIPPSIEIARNANGSVTITFSGRLQSSARLDGHFEDVAGNPEGSYSLSPEELSDQRYFRASGD